MTVPCQLLLTGKDTKHLQAVAQLAEQNTKRLERKYNFYQADSWLNQHINKRKLSSVVLDQETAQVLNQVRKLSENISQSASGQSCTDSHNYFDITVGTVKRLSKGQPELSYQQLFARCHQYMGLTSWQLEGNILQFQHATTCLDLGGVIKEYAVDQAALICRQQGVEGGLLNYGGDVISWGEKPDGSKFRVAVANPKQQGQVLCTLPLHNQALATSGHNERYFIAQEQSFSHILSGQTINNKVLSTSVLSHSTLISGIYSTALSIEPKLAVPKTAAKLFVDSDLKLHQSTDFLL